MAWKLHAIEQTQLRRKYRVDGVGRPKFDFHTGVAPRLRRAPHPGLDAGLHPQGASTVHKSNCRGTLTHWWICAQVLEDAPMAELQDELFPIPGDAAVKTCV